MDTKYFQDVVKLNTHTRTLSHSSAPEEAAHSEVRGERIPVVKVKVKAVK